jgi:hypothetical protein
METVVLIIMMMVGFSFVLKLTYHHLFGVIATCAVVAVFVGTTWQFAIEQSQTQISDWLADTNLMLDISVLLTADVVIGMAFCLLQAQKFNGDKMSRAVTVVYHVLKYIPGLLIFPTMFGLLVYAIFALTGADFATVAWSMAAVVFVAAIALCYGMKYLLPETEVRLELSFMVNALIAILGVVATVNGRTAVAGVSSVDRQSLAGVLALLIIGATAGFIVYNRKIKKHIKQI